MHRQNAISGRVFWANRAGSARGRLDFEGTLGALP